MPSPYCRNPAIGNRNFRVLPFTDPKQQNFRLRKTSELLPFNRRHPLNPPEFFVHSEHEILIFLYFKEPADVWELEHYLTERRKEIDRKYDFRSSRLTDVLGRLLYEKRLGEEELGGLREDKLKSIRSFAKFLAEDTAA